MSHIGNDQFNEAKKEASEEPKTCQGIDCIRHNGVISFSEWLHSMEKYGKPLCMSCQQKLLLKEEPQFKKYTNSK
jgi:hypothetical protein